MINKNSEIPHFFIKITASVNQSESKERVYESISNIFPTLDIFSDKKSSFLKAESHNPNCLTHLCQLVAEFQIMDAARKNILDNLLGKPDNEEKKKMVRIYLNKQVASIKKISFSSTEDSPLGPIVVDFEISNEYFQEFLDSYFPTFEMTQK